MIIVDDIVQGTEEWVKLRLGVVTASGVSKLLAFGQKEGWVHPGCERWHKSEEVALKCKRGGLPVTYKEELTAALSSQRSAYRNQLLAEWATGEPVDAFLGNVWTERGQLFEGHSVDFFRFETGLDAKHVALVFRDETRTCGASPDGLVVDEQGEVIGGLEIKTPLASTQVGYLLGGRPPYDEQVQFSLWASGLPRWWFLSYFPGLPPYLQEMEPIPEYQAAFDEHIPQFLRELADGKRRLIEAGAVL